MLLNASPTLIFAFASRAIHVPAVRDRFSTTKMLSIHFDIHNTRKEHEYVCSIKYFKSFVAFARFYLRGDATK